jgi:hypothetical protein
MGTELVPETLYSNELTRLCAREDYIELINDVKVFGKDVPRTVFSETGIRGPIGFKRTSLEFREKSRNNNNRHNEL